jgi:hypothetical protein
MLTMILAANVLQDLFNQLLLEALVGILGSWVSVRDRKQDTKHNESNSKGY